MQSDKQGRIAAALMLLLALAAASLLFDRLPARFPPLGTVPGTLALTVLEDTLRTSLVAAFLAGAGTLRYSAALRLAGGLYLTRFLPLSLAVLLPKTPVTVPVAALLVGFAVRPGLSRIIKNLYTPQGVVTL